MTSSDAASVGPDSAELIEAARKIFAIAQAGGVRVAEAELRDSMRGFSTEDLARAPAGYQSMLDDMLAEGLDPNDPDWMFKDAIPLDEAIDRGLLGVTREQWNAIQRERECGAST